MPSRLTSTILIIVVVAALAKPIHDPSLSRFQEEPDPDDWVYQCADNHPEQAYDTPQVPEPPCEAEDCDLTATLKHEPGG